VKRTTKQTKQAHVVDDDDARTVFVHNPVRASLCSHRISISVMTFSCCIFYYCFVSQSTSAVHQWQKTMMMMMTVNVVAVVCYLLLHAAYLACFIHLYYSLFLDEKFSTLGCVLLLSLWTLVIVVGKKNFLVAQYQDQ